MGCSHHSCSVALCPDPPQIVNGTVTFTGNSINDTATYTCNSGFELIGPSVITCAKLVNDSSMAAFHPFVSFCHREYCINISVATWVSCVNCTGVRTAILVHGVITIYCVFFITPISFLTDTSYACKFANVAICSFVSNN